MEPKLPSPDRGPEFHVPVPKSNGEAISQIPEYEVTPGGAPERIEDRNEAAPTTSLSDAATTALPAPAPPAADDDSATLPSAQDDAPAAAADNDLIEKEWVDRAKKVIADTKDDPYRREQEVARLQADYLYKRYGRKLGSPQQ